MKEPKRFDVRMPGGAPKAFKIIGQPDDAPAQKLPPVEETEAAIQALPSAFQQRAKAEADRFRNATDSEYWVAICFQTRDQKEEFLRATGLLDLGDKYIDGAEAAEVLGVELTTETPKWREAGPKSKLAKLT